MSHPGCIGSRGRITCSRMARTGAQSGCISDGFTHRKQKSVALRNEKGEKLRIQLTQILWVSGQTALIRPILCKRITLSTSFLAKATFNSA